MQKLLLRFLLLLPTKTIVKQRWLNFRTDRTQDFARKKEDHFITGLVRPLLRLCRVVVPYHMQMCISQWHTVYITNVNSLTKVGTDRCEPVGIIAWQRGHLLKFSIVGLMV